MTELRERRVQLCKHDLPRPSKVSPVAGVSLRVHVVSEVTSGAVIVVESEEALVKVIRDGLAAPRVMTLPWPSPSGSVAVPDKVTVSPSVTVGHVWPCHVDGRAGELPVTVISSMCQDCSSKAAKGQSR